MDSIHDVYKFNFLKSKELQFQKPLKMGQSVVTHVQPPRINFSQVFIPSLRFFNYTEISKFWERPYLRT